MPTYFRYDSWVKSVLGQAIAGAQVWVCFQPANTTPPITPPNTTPVPWIGPNPQAPVYSDPNGVSLVTQPLLTDGFGHYDFYALPGIYTVVIYNQGKLQNFYPDQSLGNVGSNGTSNAVLFETNGVVDAKQLLRNLVSTPSVSVATDGSGNTTFTASGGGSPLVLKTNGVLNGSQSLLNLSDGTGVHITQDGSGNVTVTNTVSAIRTGAISYTIDGGGSTITTGIKGQLDIPLNCTVTGWVVTGDQSGSAVVDVLRSSYAGFPTTASIAGTDKPTLSSAQKNENLAISAWGSTALLAGDQIQFNVNSATTVQRLNLTMIVTMSG